MKFMHHHHPHHGDIFTSIELLHVVDFSAEAYLQTTLRQQLQEAVTLSLENHCTSGVTFPLILPRTISGPTLVTCWSWLMGGPFRRALAPPRIGRCSFDAGWVSCRDLMSVPHALAATALEMETRAHTRTRLCPCKRTPARHSRAWAAVWSC